MLGRPPTSKSGYYGVKFVKRNTRHPWVATLNKIHLGSFSTAKEANEVVQNRIKEQTK